MKRLPERSDARREIFVRPIPIERRWQTYAKRNLRRIAELFELRNIGTAAFRAARGGRPPDHLELVARMRGNAVREVRDGDLVHGPDVVDAEMLPLLPHHQNAAHQIVDMAEAAGLAAVALKREGQLAARMLARDRLEP